MVGKFNFLSKIFPTICIKKPNISVHAAFFYVAGSFAQRQYLGCINGIGRHITAKFAKIM